jgi:hypothetical protein
MKRKKVMMQGALLAFLVAGSVCLLAASDGQSAATNQASAPATKAGTPSATAKGSAQSPAAAKNISQAGAPTRYAPTPISKRAQLYYDLIWGVDSLQVKYAESGEMIRFSYRVLDPGKAKAINDKRNEPSLIDPKAGVKLVIPSLEKVGKLRQSSPPELGKSYWMAFSNKGRMVKPGDHVNVLIGNFQANGLVVE